MKSEDEIYKSEAFTSVINAYTDVADHYAKFRREQAAEIALLILGIEKEFDAMVFQDYVGIQVRVDDLKEVAFKLSQYSCGDDEHLLRAFGDSVRAIATRVAAAEEKATSRCDCHPLNDKEVRQKVWELTGGRCTYCDCQLENGGTVGASFVVEHVVPRSCGGPDNIANYVPACASCNNSKGDRHVLQFIQTKMDRRRPPLTVVPLPIAAAE